eukprot:gene16233-22399_t
MKSLASPTAAFQLQSTKLPSGSSNRPPPDVEAHSEAPTAPPSPTTLTNMPNLPARKAGGKRVPPVASNHRDLPILHAGKVVLEDGTEVQITTHIDCITLHLCPLLRPDLVQPSRGAWDEAFGNMQQSMTPQMNEKFNALKDDPELKEIFDDVTKNGPGAFKKYWDDMEMMSKISNKMRAMELEKAGAAGASGEAAPAAPARNIANLHDAAKFGDVAAAEKFIEEGKDVNEKNDKGVSSLGVAVGFNRVEMVKFLISKGADIELPDSKGNTVMHYAAGYGRKQIAELLIEAGADLHALNGSKEKPIDVAKMNKEKLMVQFLRDTVNARIDEAEEEAKEQSTA